jgi:flagellin
MIINHNLNAMNAHRQLGMNTVNAGKSMEKLSSGLRINRAGDDAAGLSISEKMRAQIRGLDQAARNAQDGISLIQTAEGALQETHSILQRMRELAVQAANDTNVVQDRDSIQNEMNQLRDEIDRIANNTEFNKQKILVAGTGTSTSGSTSGTTPSVTVKVAGVDLTIQIGQGMGDIEIIFTEGTDEDVAWSDNKLTVTLKENKTDYAVSAIEDLIKGATKGAPNEFDPNNVSVLGTGTIDLSSVDLTAPPVSTTINTGDASSTSDDKDASSTSGDKFNATFQVGANKEQTFSIEINDMTAKSLGLTSGSGIDVTDNEKANAAIETIDNAIKLVSEQRSNLGAYQNRLEHTINNLGTSSENLTAAESRIRDVDMAKEIMAFSKNNILAQAAQAMLAQANQQPQGVLQLLR